MKFFILTILLLASSFVYAEEYEEIARCVIENPDEDIAAKAYVGISLNEDETRALLSMTLVFEKETSDVEDAEDGVRPQDQFVTAANSGAASVSEEGIVTILTDEEYGDESISFDMNVESFVIDNGDEDGIMKCINTDY